MHSTLQEVFNYWLARWTVQLCSVLCQILGLLFEGHEIYQPWVSPCLFVGTFLRGKQTCCLPCPLSSQSYPLLLTLYVRVEVVFCLVQWDGETECYASQVLTLVFMATLVWPNVGHQPSHPRDTENKDTLCTHLGALGPVQPP